MTSTSEHAVTVLISRQVKSGCEAEFERVMNQIMAVTETFKGHLGAQMIRPGDEQGVYDSLYHIVLAFDSEPNLKVWQNSPARSLGLAAAAPFIKGQELVRQVSGLGLWFQPPTGTKLIPPPRWKVAVVTWLGIFPTVYLLFFVLGDLLAPLPQLIRLMFLTVLVVGLMTWVVAPQLTRLFKPWLYSASKE
ncbi:antibiotic biosynthesis monooxygenase [Rhodoferax sp.]|uniref:antibiotic biosynthesis monooxygenase n=1 Tax=Rhodoferax sp. TaxID=50421 RepID=UPI0025F035B2|nr:antibiotic biosynthesis monooxygenase [Rhodoferax sp.]MCM2339728.1 antibiotic biosynthesis monooxygenase [Rhodoferax sp.]